MNDPQDGTFEKLVAAVRRDPKDQTARGALADRLQEIGEYELEALWRGGAEAWLRDLAKKIVYTCDDPPYKVGDSLTYDDLMAELDDWVRAGDFNETTWVEPYRFSRYQLTTGCDVLDDPETSEMTWRCVEIVLGRRIPAAAKECGGRVFDCGSCGI